MSKAGTITCVAPFFEGSTEPFAALLSLAINCSDFEPVLLSVADTDTEEGKEPQMVHICICIYIYIFMFMYVCSHIHMCV